MQRSHRTRLKSLQKKGAPTTTTDMAGMKLLGWWASPYVMRARVALNLKGVAYEFLEEDMGDKSELLLKSNPVYEKIPVLIHDGKPVCESMIIVQYIDEVYDGAGLSILPADPYDRAITRFWAFYIDSDKWAPSLRDLMKAQTDEAKSEAVTQVHEGMKQLEEAFVQISKGKGFFNGDSLGYLDIAFGCHLGWLRTMEVMTGVKFLEENKTPHLVGWSERFASHEAVRGVLPDTEKLVELAKVICAHWKAYPPSS